MAGTVSRLASALDPAGPGAEAIAALWWIMLALGTAIFALVVALLLRALYRRRSGAEDAGADARRDGRTIVAGGIALPALVVAALMVVTITVGATDYGPAGREFRAGEEDRPPAAGEDAPLEIDVVGHQFWWQVRYPEYGFETANEIHVPRGRDVRLRLTSADVIHSVWVPELGGKADMVPGKTNTLTIRADELGVHVGKCAEFCGVQHALMELRVIAQEPAEFDAWRRAQAEPAREPDTAPERRGRRVFLGTPCAACHTIRGTPARADVGPDLTHLASRRTLAAGVIENDRGNLAGWVIDPQGIKPGNHMPPTTLRPQQLQDLLAYLESLR